jgi:hypothetical protein
MLTGSREHHRDAFSGFGKALLSIEPQRQNTLNGIQVRPSAQ